MANHLAAQTSPYLLQHANNPVNWHPWGPDALARAQREDKPIIVSIGYSTCHWCHVMERESFEDEATAVVMNDNFICIKVDREERPDVDQVYMDACQAISGGGGWPLNAFLLPDGRPFYAGTYYPPVRKYNRPSWTELLEHIAQTFSTDRAGLETQAANLVNNISTGSDRLLNLETKSDAPVEAMLEEVRTRYDRTKGGFGGAPKFPQSQSLELLLASGILTGNNNDIFMAGHGMLSMLDGGIYDHLGGGFSRYTVDANWRVPHFEKMLYDNALLLQLLGKLQAVTPNPRYATAIAETTTWLQREMLLPNGGYRAALDADSEGVEGKYYVWDYEELEALLPPGDVELVARFYGITREGNWEEEKTNIPYRPDTLAAVAAAVEMPEDVASAKIAAANNVFHEYRLQRIPPGADDKLILQWNALLISGWTWCYRGTGEERYLKLATELYTALQRQLCKEGNWYRNLTSGKLGAPAFLDDYAALASAALDLAEVTFELDYSLEDARTLIDRVLEEFSDGTMFYLRPPAGSELPVATKDFYDNALPSGNSQMARNLHRLGQLTGKTGYTERAEQMVAALAGGLERYPTSFGNWALLSLLMHSEERELAVTGKGAKAAAAQFLSDYRPGLLIVATERPREDVPLLTNRYLGNETHFFVCENQQCRMPVNSVAEALELLNR